MEVISVPFRLLLYALKQYIGMIGIFFRMERSWSIAVHSKADLERIAFQFVNANLVTTVQDVHMSGNKIRANCKARRR